MLMVDGIAKADTQASSPAERDSLEPNALPCESFADHGGPSSHLTESYGPQRLRANHIVTKRLANTFSSPFSSPLKGPNTSSPAGVNQQSPTRLESGTPGINLMAEISALERRKQVLKQAIKIRNAPAEEERLSNLVTQWRQAGRDIVESLFRVIPRPHPPSEGDTLQSLEWENGLFSAPETSTMGTDGDEEKAVTEDWNYGTMMRSLQVDPNLLGWDCDAEDWAGS